jgi:uncharacterized membrane protein
MDYLKVVGTAILPIIELKGAIPIGYLTLGMPLWTAFWLAYLGSCIPVPFILLFIKKIIHWMAKSKVKVFNRFSNWLLGKVEKNRSKINKYGYLAVFAFVAIPLPGTGVWTGSLLGAMMDMEIKKALPVIILGNLVAGIAITAISYGAGQLTVG